MTEKRLNGKEINFCRYYALTQNHREAAARAGYINPDRAGLKLLSRANINAEIQKYIVNAVDRESVLNGLKRIAFGSVADAVRLIMGDEDAKENPEKLDLFCVSEIKVQKGGGVEIKFFDRIKALEKINEFSVSVNVGKDNPFISAIEQGVQLIAEDWGSE
ncbi:MAG: terminase small subunit [bacterium]|nr:terminase small subunit [bacterium]